MKKLVPIIFLSVFLCVIIFCFFIVEDKNKEIKALKQTINKQKQTIFLKKKKQFKNV